MKVLLFQVFDRQKVIQIDEEPIHICGSGQSSNLFLVCLKSGRINVYSAAGEVPLIYSFPAHNENVVSLAYSHECGAIVTIEAEDAQSAIHVVRVYRLPRTQDLEPYFTNVKWKREAETKESENEGVQVYQLPLHASVNVVTVCPKTGRIAVATESDISVWNPVDGGEYEKMFQIETRAVKNIAIHGPYLAYCTDRTVHVFECMVTDDVGNREEMLPKVRLHSGPSAVITDEHTVIMKSRGNNISANVAIPCISISNENNKKVPREIRRRVKFGPISDVSIVLKVEPRYTVKTFHLLVYEKYSSELGSIHTLFFLPEYSHIVQDDELVLSTDNTPTHNPQMHNDVNEIGMRCFVSTRMEGKLYNVCEPCELAAYAYTSPTLQCCANDEFLYAVADAEVSAFTLRTSLSGAEYDPIPPCLMGMKNFLGPCRILAPGGFVVLLSKIKASEAPALMARFRSPTKRTPMRPKRKLPVIGADDDESDNMNSSSNVDWDDGEEINWIMYSMHPYSLHMLYDDIIERALTTVSLSTTGSATVDGADSLGYYQLVLEGHFLLQAKIVSLKRRIRAAVTRESRDALVLDLQAYVSLLRHSSGVLGDYFFRATKEYHKAAQCYSDSDRKISGTVSMFLEREEARGALVEYLDRVLFDLRMRDYSEETAQLSDAILVYYAEYAPHRLSTVVVDSFVKRYTRTTALALLCLAPSLVFLTPRERRERIASLERCGYSLTGLSSAAAALLVTPKDGMACVLEQLALGMRDQSIRMLKRMDPSHIVDFCTSYPHLLEASPGEATAVAATATTHATPLVCALRDAAPLALLEAAVKLGGDPAHLSVFDAVAAVSARKVLRVFCLEHKLMPHERERIAESVVHLSDGPHVRYEIETLPSAECAAELADLYLDMALEGGQCSNYDELRVGGSGNDGDCFGKWLERHQKVFIESSPQWLNDLFEYVCDGIHNELGVDDGSINVNDGGGGETVSIIGGDGGGDVPMSNNGSASVNISRDSIDISNDDSIGAGNGGTINGDNDDEEDKNQSTNSRELNLFYVRKLVGLLCSGLLRDPSSLVERLHTAAVAASSEATAVGARNRKMLDVALALAGPLTASKRSFSELVLIAPGAALDFGMSFCAGPGDWKAVLDALLCCCSNRKGGDACTDVAVDVYESVLEYTALLYEPDVFLGLLPSDGNLEFFRRYIELSFQKNDARSVQTEFMSLLQSIENGVRLL